MQYIAFSNFRNMAKFDSHIQTYLIAGALPLTLTLSNRYSKYSNLNLKFCVALWNAIWKSYTKNEENLFFDFLFIIIFFLFRILTWNFVWGFAMLLINLMQKMKKIYPWNSDLCKLFLQKYHKTCGTHRSQQAWKG